MSTSQPRRRRDPSSDCCRAGEARLESEAFVSWKGAREASDFSKFAPDLSKIFALKSEVAKTTRPEICERGEAYDGALDQFERGMTSMRLDEIFGETRAGLRPLLARVLEKKREEPAVDALHPALAFDHPGWTGSAEKQAELSKRVAGDLGFDFSKGRFDVSTHPFTGGACPTDTRITTRYSDGNWLEGFAGTVHEVGHALYEQGRSTDEEGDGLPVSRALSMGTHESQSLLWERMVLQSRDFWDYATPLFHEFFPHTSDATAEDFYRAINRVQPGLIRVEADELSYPFHVFLRYDVERSLLAGDLDVATIPQRWNSVMKDVLDVDVPDDAKGALQDIHWSFGAVGYFPSYVRRAIFERRVAARPRPRPGHSVETSRAAAAAATWTFRGDKPRRRRGCDVDSSTALRRRYTLGAMMAAQIWTAAEAAVPDLGGKIRAGDFAPLREWLRTSIHEVGSTYASPDDLLRTVTGAPLEPRPFLDYLERKYTALYGL